MPQYCDLHTHSDRSDGTETPTEVVRLAAAAGLAAVALTDHDTLAGVPEAADAGRKLGVRVVPGVELSLPHTGTLHVIGLGVDPQDAELAALAARLRAGRGPRNQAILERLRELGIDLDMEEVRRHAAGDVVARPHIARAMLERGFVSTMQEAFDRYLTKGGPAYAERARGTLAEAVRIVRAAGGATVLCHPFTLGHRAPGDPADEERLRADVAALRDRGIDAMEVRYGAYSKKQERFWEGVARDAGLLFSGGSDFHGSIRPNNRVGRGRGRMRVPAGWLDALLERAASRGPPDPGGGPVAPTG